MTPAIDIPLKQPAVSATAGDAEQLERAVIDASTRVPVLMFYASAMVWLLLGTVLAGFALFKLPQWPEWEQRSGSWPDCAGPLYGTPFCS